MVFIKLISLLMLTCQYYYLVAVFNILSMDLCGYQKFKYSTVVLKPSIARTL